MIKLNKLEKFILLAVSAATIATCPTQANMADTQQQAADRYGRPIRKNGDNVIYHAKGYVIQHWFNPEGLAEAVYYTKLNGNISQAEIDAICGVNLPSYIHREDWIEQQADNSSYRLWFSLDGNWRFERGTQKMGKYVYCYFNIMTMRAASVEKNTANPQTEDQKISTSLPL